MKAFESPKRRLQIYHLLYWVVFTVFFTIVWGTYDNDYSRNLMVQILSLPSRLVLVYVTILVLFPKFLEKEKFIAFIMTYIILLLICTLLIQRPMILFVVEGKYLPTHQSEQFFNLIELTNTMLDVNIAAIVPVGSKLIGYWMKSRVKVDELQVLNQKLANYKNQFILFKKGSQKHKIFLHDIIFLESIKNSVKVSTTEKEHIFYGSITELEQTLKDVQFIRVHRSFIVNLNFMESFSNTNIVVRGFDIPIGRKYKPDVMNAIKR